TEDQEVGLMGLRAGASGFLAKSVGVDALPRALRGAKAGEAVVSRRMAMRVIEGLRKVREDGSGMRPVRSRLTSREWEVLDLLCEQYAGTLGPGVDDALQGMLNGTERLRRYVDDLLDLQHARDPAEGTADLDAALAGAVEELRVFIERAKARVESGALGQAAV